MSDFNLLGFLNIKVPNEPLTPISQKKESYKILSPSSKPEDLSPSRTKKTPERSLDQITADNNNTSTPKAGKQGSPYYRTTYANAYGGATSSSSEGPVSEEDTAPLTPGSVSSVSSIASNVSVCEDPECDDCLNKKHQAAKRALAAHEKDMERSEYLIAKRKLEEEIALEQRQEAEKREARKREVVAEKERHRNEKVALREQKEREDEEDAAMLRELSKDDRSAIEAAKARNAVYRTDLLEQKENDRLNRIAQEEERKAAAPGEPLGFGEEEEARELAREATSKDILNTLKQQKADKLAAGKAEKDAELKMVRRAFAESEEKYQREKAIADEKDRLQKKDILDNNRQAEYEKKVHASEAFETERAWTHAQFEQNRKDDEAAKRKADENKRAELESLHRQLSEQVRRRREVQRLAKEEDRAYAPKETKPKSTTLIHCVDCELDLPPKCFSNYIVTSNGKVYRKSKAIPRDSPLHKYMGGRKEAAPMDFSHNYS